MGGWFKSIGMESYSDMVLEKNISGHVLNELSCDDIKEEASEVDDVPEDFNILFNDLKQYGFLKKCIILNNPTNDEADSRQPHVFKARSVPLPSRTLVMDGRSKK